MSNVALDAPAQVRSQAAIMRYHPMAFIVPSFSCALYAGRLVCLCWPMQTILEHMHVTVYRQRCTFHCAPTMCWSYLLASDSHKFT